MTKENKSMNIYQRLNAIMEKVSYVQKEEKKVNNQYRFVSHDAVTSAVQPYLVEFGVVPVPTVINRVQDGNRTEVDVRVDFVNMDAPEEKVEVTMFGYGVDQQDKGPGKAFSYAKKYAFLQLFCLATGDDPERDNVDHKKTVEKPKWNGPIQRSKFSDAVIQFNKDLDECTNIEEFAITKQNNKAIWAQIQLDTPADAKLKNPDCVSGETTKAHINRLHMMFEQQDEINQQENR